MTCSSSRPRPSLLRSLRPPRDRRCSFAAGGGSVAVAGAGSGAGAGGAASDAIFNTESQSVTLIYTDSTRGWIDIHDSTSNAEGATFITGLKEKNIFGDGR